MIEVAGLTKTFKVAERPSGLGEAVKALFHRKYRTVEALKDISFHIDAGEIVGYIGPNGAGKSTTIKVMSGILVPDGGKCSIMGRTPWKERVGHVKGIGVVFGQRSQLWWDVPVEDSFELLRDIYRISDREYRKNLDLLTGELDLGNLLGTPVRQLSLGQRMRCELAASLLHSPGLLFLDEPTIGLDAVSKMAVRSFIKRINKEKGVTVILTTHDMNDIEALTDRILLIGKGNILYDGCLDELKGRYVTHKTVTVDFGGLKAGKWALSSFKAGKPVEKPTGNPAESLTEGPANNLIDNPVAVHLDRAELLSWTQERAVYRVDIQKTPVSDVIAELSQKLDIVDVEVNSPPVEEMIVKLYKEHKI